MLIIQKHQLRAALNCAAKKDIRYYLQGVLLEVTQSGVMHLVGTDGHVMFCGVIYEPEWTETPQVGPWSMIIPADVIARECKGRGTVELKAMDSRYTLGASVFSPLDARYPDWRRVSIQPDPEPKPGSYNPALLSAAKAALMDWFDSKKIVTHLHQSGPSIAGVMTAEQESAYCIIMPMKTDPLIMPFKPRAYAGVQA